MNLSPTEYAHYVLQKDIEQQNISKIEEQFTALTDSIESYQQERSFLNKQVEILEEQCYFRDTFIEQVLEACKITATKKELVKFITNTLQNSYIEL